MSIADALLPEFDHEMASTRRVLERTPEAAVDWKPHPKSWALGDLALHLANLPTWVGATVRQTELDLHPPGAEPPAPRRFESTAALLTEFDANVQDGRAAIAAAADADFSVPWTLKNAGAPLFTMPRASVLRTFVMNHIIHHRGQFTVYLRLREVPLPSIYGPSADERP